MKYAVCTIALRDRPVDKAFALIRASGYQYADIHPCHLPLALAPAEVAGIVDLARSHGIAIGSLASGVGDGLDDPDAGKRQAAVLQLKQCIDQATQLGATVIRTGLGDLTEYDSRMRDFVVPALEEALAYAAPRNVKIGVETHSGGITQTVEGCCQVCAAIPSEHFGILYDPGNLLGVLQDYKKLLDLIPDRIVHVHLKDGFPATFNDQYAHQRLSCTAFGKGQLDIPFILRQLGATGYKGFVSVEYEAWHPEYHLPPVETGLKDCLGYLNAAISPPEPRCPA